MSDEKAQCLLCRTTVSAAADLPRLADDVMQQTRLLFDSPRDMNCKDALAIYREVT